MPTIEEIRTEWKTIRSALGNLICYIDGKTEQLGDMDAAYCKGYNNAKQEVALSGEYERAYQRGLEDAWKAAIRYAFNMSEFEAEKVLKVDYAPTELRRITPQDAIQRLKEYDDIMHRVTHSNANKFVEVFGFAPGYEVLDDGREVYPSLNDEWWNAEYKEPKGEVE